MIAPLLLLLGLHHSGLLLLSEFRYFISIDFTYRIWAIIMFIDFILQFLGLLHKGWSSLIIYVSVQSNQLHGGGIVRPVCNWWILRVALSSKFTHNWFACLTLLWHGVLQAWRLQVRLVFISFGQRVQFIIFREIFVNNLFLLLICDRSSKIWFRLIFGGLAFILFNFTSHDFNLLLDFLSPSLVSVLLLFNFLRQSFRKEIRYLLRLIDYTWTLLIFVHQYIGKHWISILLILSLSFAHDISWF